MRKHLSTVINCLLCYMSWYSWSVTRSSHHIHTRSQRIRIVVKFYNHTLRLRYGCIPMRYYVSLALFPRGCTHQDYIRGSPSEKMKKTPKVSDYFAYYPKVSSSLMERTQKYHRIVKRQGDLLKLKSQYALHFTILQVISHLPN